MSGEEGEGRAKNLDEALLARKTLDFVLIFIKNFFPQLVHPSSLSSSSSYIHG